MTKESSRIKIREECEKLFLCENKNLVLEWATGVGKTFNSLNLCDKSKFNRILIFVAETQHIQMWIDDMNLNGFSHLIEKVHFSCYHSIKKYQNVECDLIILDEGHHAFSDKRISYLKSINAKRAILLSATINNNEYDSFCKIFDNVYRYSIDFKLAIKSKLLNVPIFNIYTFKLNDKSRSETIEFKRGNGNLSKIECNYPERMDYIYNKKKYPNIHLTIKCTQKEKYDYIENNYSYLLKKFRLDNNMGRLLIAGNNRKKYLVDIKTSRLKYLCNKMNSKRFICFCGSIDQADFVSENNAIHSKSKNKTPTEVVNKFNSGEISKIFAVGMLVEGTNLTNIESSIICQLDGESLKFIQKTGRGMRAELPEINILLALNTKDEEYYLESFKNIPNEYIKIKQL